MLQQRRSFTSYSGDRRGRQQQQEQQEQQEQQQASRSRNSSLWEAVFLGVLLILTCVNLYTYNGRRERFQRTHRLHRNNDNDVDGGRWYGGRGEPSDEILGTKVPNRKDSLSSAAAAAAAPSGGGDAHGVGDVDGSAATAAAGGSVQDGPTKNLPPAARPPPLGRDRPLRIVAAAPGASNDQWPAASGGSGDGSGGDAASAEGADAVTDFACSLTEVDFAPGRTRPRNTQQQLQKSWSTSGPCVISCSSSRPSPENDLPYAASLGRFGYCARAVRACELYQECTHVLMPPPPPVKVEETVGESSGESGSGGGGGAGLEGYATLMHLPAEDGSMAAVEAAAGAAATAAGGGWGGVNGGFTLEKKPRTYYVVSFGGSGSKMLGGWLSERGKGTVKKVFHIHDPRPADQLFAKSARKTVTSRGSVGKGKDFRDYDFPEGDFPVDGAAVEDVDSYRVVLIFKDPAEALVSRYFYNHCKNLRGAECGATPADFPSLERYAEESGDRLHMQAFYDNYCDPDAADDEAAAGAAADGRGRRRRNYPVVCVNYHKMWDNKEALVRALGLPAEEASKLPERTETVRNDQTSAARGEAFTLAMRERLRRKHASLSEKVFAAPAVAIV